jgi:hypothetical protein
MSFAPKALKVLILTLKTESGFKLFLSIIYLQNLKGVMPLHPGRGVKKRNKLESPIVAGSNNVVEELYTYLFCM